MKKVIFDLDGTLLFNTYEEEKKYFESQLDKRTSEDLRHNVCDYLEEYEGSRIRYDIGDLKRFLSYKTGYDFNEDFIKGWLEVGAYTDDTFDEELLETLEFLKSRDIKLAVLTNWFREPQVKRLRNSNILEYFDEVHSGEEFLKPNKQAYLNAKGDISVCDCLFVGDDLLKDYIGPKMVGAGSILYDTKEIYHDSIIKVKKMGELKRRVR